MATSTKDDRDSGVGQGKPLNPGEQAEFDQLSKQLEDTPSGDSDQPYQQPQAGGTPRNNVYDDQMPGAQAGGAGGGAGATGRPHSGSQEDGPEGGSRGANGGRGNGQDAKKDLDSDELKNKEQEDQLGKGYTPGQANDDDGDGGSDKDQGNNRNRRFRKYFKKYKTEIFTVGAFTGTITGVGVFMLSLMPWQLHNLMGGVDAHTFGRLQGVNVEGRSTKWMQAYMEARMFDIENRDGSYSDNLLVFRADRVDYNKPFTDWYRTMRTSAFERDMLEKMGIKFTSSAVREGNKIVIRPAKLVFRDKVQLEFDLRNEGVDEDTLQALLSGDVKAFEKLQRPTENVSSVLISLLTVRNVDVDIYGSNKEGRRQLKKALAQMLPVNGWNIWNGVKRYHMRKNIQNMTGITSWKFFETTRERWKEKALSARNKMLAAAIPSNTKTGKFLECMFGISSCTTRPDPMAPENRNLPPGGPNGDGRTDSEGNPLGDGRDELRPGLDTNGGANFASKIASKLLKSANLAESVVSFVNSLADFDENLSSGALSQMVKTARSQQVAALYTTFAIANDQLRTGEAVGDEVDDTMDMIANATNTEAWETVMNERPNIVNAQGAVKEFVPAANKKEYCSAGHQALLIKPEYAVQAANEFGYNCDKFKVGAATNITAFEDSWNNGIGAVLHPILVVWRNSIGVIAKLFDDIMSAITQPIMNAILSALGIDKKIEEVMGWLGQQLLEFTGAGLMWADFTPSQQIVNMAFQGGAVVAEGTTSAFGGALTTQQMEKDTTAAYHKYQAEKYAQSSLFERYLSLNNPDSIASSTLFPIVNRSPQTYGRGFLSSLGSIFTLPFRLVSKTVSAATPNLGDPYTTARVIADIPTFDFPKTECLDREVIGKKPPEISPGVWGQNGDGSKDGMTPQNATNADDIGVFKPEELNWDLMRDSERWKNEIYTRVGDDNNKAMSIWNCALLDNAVAGGMGGLYGYKGVGALSSSDSIRK